MWLVASLPTCTMRLAVLTHGTRLPSYAMCSSDKRHKQDHRDELCAGLRKVMWVPGAKVKEVEMLNGHNTELRNEAQVAALCPVVYQVSTCGLCGAGSTWAVFGTKMSCGAMRLPKRTQGEVLLCAFSGTTFGYGAMRVLCDLLVPTWGMVLPGATKGPRADEVGAGWGQGYPFAMVLGICCAVSGTESGCDAIRRHCGVEGRGW